MKKLKIIQIGVCHDHGTSAFNSILKQKNLFDVVGFAVTEEELREERNYLHKVDYIRPFLLLI